MCSIVEFILTIFILISDLPKGVTQPFVLISKLDLSPMSSNSSYLNVAPLSSNEHNASSNDLNETAQTPIRGRSGREIKPKLDPNFKYLPAGAKKHALNFGIASQANDTQQNNSRRKSMIKIKKNLNVQKAEDLSLFPFTIKTESGTNLTPPPRTLKAKSIKKRKLKPLKNVCSSYLKIRRNKHKTNGLLQNSSKLMPPTTISTKTEAQQVHTSSIVFNTTSSSNHQYQAMQSTKINLEQQHSSMYALQTFDRAPSPEAILPDDIPSHHINVTGNFISGINQNNGYLLNNAYYQNSDIKEESIEICDNGLGTLFNPSGGEAVLDFTMF